MLLSVDDDCYDDGVGDEKEDACDGDKGDKDDDNCH